MLFAAFYGIINYLYPNSFSRKKSTINQIKSINMKQIETLVAKSPEGNIYLINSYEDSNPLPKYDICKKMENGKYKTVKSIGVAREFNISQSRQGRKSPLNTREMCKKMVEKIKSEKLSIEI